MRGYWQKFAVAAMICLGLLAAQAPWARQASAFEPLAGDMSTFNPAEQVFPPADGDDVIKVGVFWAFTGPAAVNGNLYWLQLGWAVHDINSQGGVMVDGKKKKIVLIKGDNQMQTSVGKRAMERLCLEDKVDIIVGTTGSHINLVGQNVAAKYKKIYVNVSSLADSLMDGRNFNRYTFRGCSTTSMQAKALALFYAKRPEKKFYLLNEDYAYGHMFAKCFKETLAQIRPDAEVAGMDFHPLFAKDFAPYLTKIKGTGAEVIISGDFSPDIDNLIKQMSQLGMNTPLAGPFTANPLPYQAIPAPHGDGTVAAMSYMTDINHPPSLNFAMAWNKQWKHWPGPFYNAEIFKWPGGMGTQSTVTTYWLFKVIEKAGSLDPEKIIAAWEGDEFEFFGQKMKMRACDHQVIYDMKVSRMSWPNQFFEKAPASVEIVAIPAAEVAQPLPKDLDRCK